MQVNNQSPWHYLLAPMWTQNKQLRPVLVVKAGFRWDDEGAVTALDAADYEVEPVDRFYNDDADSQSVEASADAVPFKQGFEWLLVGTAHSNARAKGVEVKVEMFTDTEATITRKQLLVIGERQWEKSLLGWQPSQPKGFTACALRYEFAFGGAHAENPDERFPENPVGVGFGANKTNPLMPRMEQLPLLSKPTQTTVPAGFGPIAMHWQPRFEQWQALDAEAALLGGCPYGRNVAANLYNAAPADQQLTQPIPAGSVIQLTGLHPSLVQRFTMPCLQPQVMLNEQHLGLTCDTLIINADLQQFYLVYRLALEVPVDALLSMQLELFDKLWPLVAANEGVA